MKQVFIMVLLLFIASNGEAALRIVRSKQSFDQVINAPYAAVLIVNSSIVKASSQLLGAVSAVSEQRRYKRYGVQFVLISERDSIGKEIVNRYSVSMASHKAAMIFFEEGSVVKDTFDRVVTIIAPMTEELIRNQLNKLIERPYYSYGCPYYLYSPYGGPYMGYPYYGGWGYGLGYGPPWYSWHGPCYSGYGAGGYGRSRWYGAISIGATGCSW